MTTQTEAARDLVRAVTAKWVSVWHALGRSAQPYDWWVGLDADLPGLLTETHAAVDPSAEPGYVAKAKRALGALGQSCRLSIRGAIGEGKPPSQDVHKAILGMVEELTAALASIDNSPFRAPPSPIGFRS